LPEGSIFPFSLKGRLLGKAVMHIQKSVCSPVTLGMIV
jgi:hypothetical protein